jgi:hypothetical protein
VQPEPAVGDGTIKTGFVLRRRAFELILERAVDLLDVDAPVLHRLDSVGQLHQLARGGVRIGERAGLDELHAATIFLNIPTVPTPALSAYSENRT